MNDNELVLVGQVVSLPARNSKAFKSLPLVAQELLHSAHRLQFKLRTGKLSAEQREQLASGLLLAVTLAETCSSC